MEMDTIIFGDPHCGFDAIDDAVEIIDPDFPPTCIFLGDFGFADRDRSNQQTGQREEELPFVDGRSADEILRPLADLGCRILHVRGNHDLDNNHQYGAVISSRILRGGHLHRAVVEIDGVRIAGLDGVFGKPWHPDREDRGDPEARVADTRTEFMKRNLDYWHEKTLGHPRGMKLYRHALEKEFGLQMGHRKYIFPEDVMHLATMQADVLISHEAPKSPGLEDGFEVLGRLARTMGVKAVFHGHHHRDYASEIGGGIAVVGVGRRSVLRLNLGQYRNSLEHSP